MSCGGRSAAPLALLHPRGCSKTGSALCRKVFGMYHWKSRLGGLDRLFKAGFDRKAAWQRRTRSVAVINLPQWAVSARSELGGENVQ
jgi:hypothetical protein